MYITGVGSEGDVSANESDNDCRMDMSPGGTKYWYTECDRSLKPYEGQLFNALEDGIKFYTMYAASTGFDVRRSSDKKNDFGIVLKKDVVCSRQGFKENRGKDTMGEAGGSKKKRRRTTNRVGCGARIVMKIAPDGRYTVHKFEERHTHCLCEESQKPLMKVNRKIDIAHQEFITKCEKANVGASKSYDIYAEIVGGPQNVGATQQDFKNYRRDLLAYMKWGDVQMVISNYLEQKTDCADMYFEYEVNANDQLSRVFWADGMARKNYGAFGDVVSFDATYKTNRYHLVFVPFTGVDNHKRCVTFAAALIDKEDVESYSWVLNQFKNAMGAAPPIVITDQDPAMKIAIADVFRGSRHRYCMWHIMTKVGEKVGAQMSKNNEFRKALNTVVWNENTTRTEFEIGWKSVIGKYSLNENRWLTRMYEERASWVPAFCDDVFMGGLLRTTSRSEAENRIFQGNMNKHLCLVEFFTRFEGAVRKQRKNNLELTASSFGQKPHFETQLQIERSAATVYTLTIFYEVQKQISAGCFKCRVRSYTEANGVKTYIVEDENEQQYTVIVQDGSNIACTCRMYARVGLLCSHVFVVLKDERIDEIPPQHITPRWTRDAVKHTHIGTARDKQHGNNTFGHGNSEEGQLMNIFHRCLGKAKGRPEKLKEIRVWMEGFEATFGEDEMTDWTVNGKRAIMESYCGVVTPNVIEVHPPPVAKTKGSGKRMKSAREIAMAEHYKKKRTCKTCGVADGHNSRSCPRK
ncbi:PREDICTED: protein FAR1-RELATED SEQUENCE 5-like [Ipomoea nil]|uniref:protein FAR1-RELATED SEQUENCE 5-like n=1 Tax=Ipomoea nil TaxID=35883 RepID=UPI000901B445|nr:PREDICTED: protein FAR1-RELATED SEQUENCE 5-like [Ipomoea nil]